MDERTTDFKMSAGAADISQRAADLADHLPPGLKPLAPLAYNYRWSWLPGAEDVFREINPHRWELSGGNPVKFLSDLWPSTRAHAERDEQLKARVLELAEQVASDLDEPPQPRDALGGTVAYMCAEFGIHASLPIYSGGLGVLAGDTLKEASDQRLPMVAVGLLYSP
jgi:glucan phosphorylase